MVRKVREGLVELRVKVEDGEVEREVGEVLDINEEGWGGGRRGTSSEER